MTELSTLALAGGIALAAALYAAVGHAGASAYLALFALAGLPLEWARPTALALNLLVATFGVANFSAAGHFRWRLWAPFAIAGVPFAFLGGRLGLPLSVYRAVLGLVLAYAAAALFAGAPQAAVNDGSVRSSPAWARFLWGGVIGWVAGLVGVGGGIFLSPLLLWRRWATTRQTAAASVALIWVNSAAGLLGYLSAGRPFPTVALPWVLAAAIGGAVGGWAGSRRMAVPLLRRLLAAVLAIAAAKLLVA
jgi:uncharacterized membrane protein YfcA